ncbi:MAG: hypothetical protein ACREIC_33355 [Limisphaerales bacterium]
MDDAKRELVQAWLMAQEEDVEERARTIDEVLDEALRAPRSKISLSEVLEQERR